MTDIPIIFSASMIRALLDGRKTMTRRLAWGKPFGVDIDHDAADAMRALGHKVSGPDDTDHRIAWPPTRWQRVKPGDRLWVRETWCASGCLDKFSPKQIALQALEANYRRPWCPIKYEADGGVDKWTTDWGEFGRSRSGRFMPRWASRLTLIVTATKIERLQEIGNDDAEAEGIESELWDQAVGYRDYTKPNAWFCTWPGALFDSKAYASPRKIQRRSFKSLWISLHGPDSWDANPEVVCLSFRAVKANIDSIDARAA
jgi:hypothetical protein